MPFEQGEEQRAVAAADVDDPLVAAPADRVEPLDPALPALLHRAVERGPFRWMRGEPLPEPGSLQSRERRRAACVQAREGTQPDAPEEMREVVPAVRAQQLGRGGVLKDARRRLGEDAVARESAQ